MATLISPADGKIGKIKELLEHAIRESGITDDGAQRLIQRGGEFNEAIVPVIQRFAELVNPYAGKIVRPAWDYPEDWRMKEWGKQLEIFQKAYPQLDPTGLPEMAKHYLDQSDLWSMTFEFRDKKVRLFDGLLVFLLPGKAAAKLGLGDLWADVKRGIKGLWGKLCEDVLFKHLASQFPDFKNYRAGEMGSDRFLPTDEVAQWLQKLEADTAGDFACRPCNFGRRLAGHAVVASRWAAENLLGGIATPSWVNGNGLVTHPERLNRYGVLWIDNAGDQYRFGGARTFGDAPSFRRADAWLEFGLYSVDRADGDYGSVFVLRE